MKNKVFIVISSLIILTVSIANIIVPDKTFSENENRTLTSVPAFSFESLVNGDMSARFESYVADQFVLRDIFVSAKAHFEKLCGKKENNGVYFAKDGYLIEAPDYDANIATQNLDIIKDLNCSLLLIPTAYEVLQNKLPTFAYYSIQKDIISLAQSKTNTICPIELLKQNKDEYIYYKTDHHQTSFGSYLSYKAFCEAKNITPIKYSSTVLSNNFYGSTWSKATLNYISPDAISTVKTNINCKVTINDSQVLNSIYDYSKLETKDKYAVFLGGNYGKVIIDTSANSDKTLLLIKDSYANGLIPYLVNHYKTIVMLDLRYYNQSVKKLTEEIKPDETLLIYNVSSLATDTSFKKLLF